MDTTAELKSDIAQPQEETPLEQPTAGQSSIKDKLIKMLVSRPPREALQKLAQPQTEYDAPQDLTPVELTPEVQVSARFFDLAKNIAIKLKDSDLAKMATVIGITSAINLAGIPHAAEITTAGGFGMLGVNTGETPLEKVRNAVALGIGGIAAPELIHKAGELARNTGFNPLHVAGEVANSKPADIGLGLVDDLAVGSEVFKNIAEKGIEISKRVGQETRSRMTKKPAGQTGKILPIPEGAA